MSRRPPLSLRGLLRYLLAGLRTFTPQSRDAFDAWCSELAMAADDARRRCGDAVEVRPQMRRVTGETAGQWQRRPQLGLVGLAEGVGLLTVNAELMSSHAEDLRRDTPSSVLIPATCADEVFGYWPTSAILKEGGYEGCRSRPFFPPVDWERDDPDTLWRTMLAQALEDVPPDMEPTRPVS